MTDRNLKLISSVPAYKAEDKAWPLKPHKESKIRDDVNQNFEQLYKDYKSVVIHSLIKKGWDFDAAEEITQEAFLRLIDVSTSKIPKYLKSYVYKIAHNLAIDRIRRLPNKEIKVSKLVIDEQQENLSQSSIASEEETIQMRQTLISIQQALNDLPEACRSAFILYRVKGLSYSIIANQLGVSESMIRKHVLKAIRHCYARINKQ